MPSIKRIDEVECPRLNSLRSRIIIPARFSNLKWKYKKKAQKFWEKLERNPLSHKSLRYKITLIEYSDGKREIACDECFQTTYKDSKQPNKLLERKSPNEDISSCLLFQGKYAHPCIYEHFLKEDKPKEK